MLRNLLLSTLVFGLLTACAALPFNEDAPLPTNIPPTPTTAPAEATPIPTVESTPDQPDNLTLWWPDALLVTAGDDETTDVLNSQIAAFAASEDGVIVETRLKRPRDVGGIMQTLGSAQAVAPGALPDLTLMRREDLITAVQQNVIYPMEGIVPSAIIGDLYPMALEMGQVDNTLYGLSYALELDFMVYSAGLSLPDNRFDTFLASERTFWLPAARPTGLNSTVLVQYLAAGGTFSDQNALVANEDALLTVFGFYEQLAAQGRISPDVIGYSRALDYRSIINEPGFGGGAVVNAQLYLDLVANGAQFDRVPILTPDGSANSILNGWVWVVTTSDPNRQRLAAALVAWMMDANRQAAYTAELNLLPSQRSAMRRQLGEDFDQFISELVSTGIIAQQPQPFSGTVARAIQTAFNDVITGEQTAEEATQSVLDGLNDR